MAHRYRPGAPAGPDAAARRTGQAAWQRLARRGTSQSTGMADGGRLARGRDLAGWQVSLSDPAAWRSEARLWGLHDLRLQEGNSPPRQPAQPLADVDHAVAPGRVTFSWPKRALQQGAADKSPPENAVASGRLHSPVGGTGGWRVNGTFPLYGGQRRGADPHPILIG
ncbi:hypothetical protein D4N21_24840 [Klebsiella variicola]|nr:hypothetical protein D4N21_24840 [Klebsiella variicola]